VQASRWDARFTFLFAARNGRAKVKRPAGTNAENLFLEFYITFREGVTFFQSMPASLRPLLAKRMNGRSPGESLSRPGKAEPFRTSGGTAAVVPSIFYSHKKVVVSMAIFQMRTRL
jgi:hypothetical protein